MFHVEAELWKYLRTSAQLITMETGAVAISLNTPQRADKISLNQAQYQRVPAPKSNVQFYNNNNESAPASRVSIDNQSAITSIITNSSGRQSQLGATWRQALINTLQRGYGSGGPRLGKCLGVRQTGREPARVPGAMFRALGVDVYSPYNVDVDEGDIVEILAGYEYEVSERNIKLLRDPGRNLRVLYGPYPLTQLMAS